MKCQKLHQALTRCEVPDLPPEMLSHSRECPDCARVLELEQGLPQNLEILGRATPKIDLTANIMARIAQEQAAAEPARESLLDRVLALLVPAGFLKPALAVSLVVLVAVLTIQSGTFRSGPSPVAGDAWQMAFVSGTGSTLPQEWLGEDKKYHLPSGENIHVGEGTHVALSLPGRAEVSVQDGSFIPLGTGLFLAAGKAEVKVQKHSPNAPFVIGTPYAEVVVVGTQFTLDLQEDSLSVKVTEGRVRVIHTSGVQELTKDMSTVVRNEGFATAQPQTVTVPPPDESADPSRIKGGQTGSRIEEENPGH